MRYVAALRPWGEQRYAEGAAPTEFHFTGQRELSVLGLHFYGARWYDSALGRFIQADTVVPLESQGVQAWDRYAYVNNNPVRYNDPTGHCIDGITTLACITVIGMAAGALIGGGIDAYNQYQETGQVDVEQVAEAALAGAVVGGGLVIGGALIGAGVAAGTAAIAGAGAAVCADGDCTNEGTALARSLGQAGETAAGIIKNTQRIPSASGTASYRVPDQLFPEQLISEVKNVNYQGLTNQINDFLSYTQAQGIRFELIVRQNTEISKPLQELIDAGKILLNRNLPRQ
jgi:RHS repeat-associated protein